MDNEIKTYVNEIYNIKNPMKFFEKNLNSVYILTTIGIRNYLNNDDEIGNQINNLKILDYIFNVNEIIVFRTFLNNEIIIYELLENKLHIIKTKLDIINVYLTIENYIIIKYVNNKNLDIINIKNFKSLIVKTLTDELLLYNYMFDLIHQLILQENIFKNYINIKKCNEYLLPESKVNNTQLNNLQLDNLYFTNDKTILKCEKIWCFFTLQHNPCINFSLIENDKRLFKYYISINKEKKYFENILELLKFLNENFYDKIRKCSFVVQ